MAEIENNIKLNGNQIHEMALKIAEITATTYAGKIGASRDDIISEFMTTYIRAHEVGSKKFSNQKDDWLKESPFDSITDTDSYNASGRGLKF